MDGFNCKSKKLILLRLYGSDTQKLGQVEMLLTNTRGSKKKVIKKILFVLLVITLHPNILSIKKTITFSIVFFKIKFYY